MATCTVNFDVELNDVAVQGAVCKARLLGTNQATADGILSTQEASATTDVNGEASLSLIQHGSFTKGSGVYKIWLEIDGNPVASVQTKIPNQSTVLFEDLLR